MERDVTARYRLIGLIGSPYSVKMRAILRYRRIPFDWVQRTMAVMPEVAHLKPPLIPVLQYPEDGSYHLDSTLLAYALEKRHPGQRSIVPEDPGLAFLSHLIEDMADEWGTKIMFHYRWFREVDQVYCSQWLARETMGPVDEETVAATAKMLRERQVGRMPLVGCTPENQPLVEETYFRVLDLLERNLSVSDFLFGSRPALADFGWFGQLYQCTFDPTPMALMRERAPRTYQWIQRLDDASGMEGAWIDPAGPLPEAVVGLLRLAGEVYLPFLQANAAALDAGAERFSFTALGRRYAQGAFKYQAKCLGWLREELAALTGEPRRRVMRALEETGCREALQG
jgi:glutathione S-transferase